MPTITNGKWTFDDGAEPRFDSTTGMPYLSIYAQGFEIIRVHGNGKTNSKADAYLVASAPEMLIALKQLLILIQSGADFQLGPKGKHFTLPASIEKLIAKAEGTK